MNNSRNRLQTSALSLLAGFVLLMSPLAHLEATPAKRTEHYTVSGTIKEIALGSPIRFESSVPVLGEFLLSIPPPTFRLSYDLEVELDYPAIVRQGSSAEYKISITEGMIKPAIELAHGVFKMGPVSLELPQRTFNMESSFPPGQAVTLHLAPGISVPLTLVTTTHVKASAGAMLSKETLECKGLSTQAFEVKPPVGAKPGDIINVALDFAVEPKVGLNLDLKEAGQLLGLPTLPAISGLPSLTWKVTEITLDVVALSPPISTSVEVIKAPFPIVPIVVIVGLILVVATIVVTGVLRQRAKRWVGQQQRGGMAPK